MHTIVNYTSGELWLWGSNADEIFFGDPTPGARNIFWMQGGNDAAWGRTGDDIFFKSSGTGFVDGAAGTDLVSFYYADGWVTASLQDGSAARHPTLIHDTATMGSSVRLDIDLHSIENLYGSNFTDLLEGDDGGNLIRGWGQDDRIDGLAGNDTLHGDEGYDQISGGRGHDLILGGLQDDTLWGHVRPGLSGASSDDRGSDTLNGGGGDDELYGQDGRDVLDGGVGNDYLVGGTGPDTFIFDDPGVEVSSYIDTVSDFDFLDRIVLEGQALTNGTALTDIAQLDDNFWLSGPWWTGMAQVNVGDGFIDGFDSAATIVDHEGRASLRLDLFNQTILFEGVTRIDIDDIQIA
ncbi:MAG: calcium-binding protein [Pseudomonadota bacterium]